jgi:hypothetical protein
MSFKNPNKLKNKKNREKKIPKDSRPVAETVPDKEIKKKA